MDFMGGRAEKWNRSSEELEGKVSVCVGVGDEYHSTLYEILKK